MWLIEIDLQLHLHQGEKCTFLHAEEQPICKHFVGENYDLQLELDGVAPLVADPFW